MHLEARNPGPAKGKNHKTGFARAVAPEVAARCNNNFRNQVAEIRKGERNAILICMDYKESVKTGVPRRNGL